MTRRPAEPVPLPEWLESAFADLLGKELVTGDFDEAAWCELTRAGLEHVGAVTGRGGGTRRRRPEGKP